jgi:tRNA nucleotidyltransferase (CCA-adding enzyme)
MKKRKLEKFSDLPQALQDRAMASLSTDVGQHTEDWSVTLPAFCPGKVGTAIVLSPLEKNICDLFCRVNENNNLKTIVRVAGGWVRDKLLGKENDDIDIAVDDMTGVEYAKLVQATMKEEGLSVGSVGVIQANPAQSKHLETACMNIYGQSIDIVNLRAEVYSEDSRIPEMLFGTAPDDAMRRDFTINALFYNVNVGEVEDFTGKGLNDLMSGTIRTPVEPLKTFADDPLRVLRVVKFASRYAFSIDTLIKHALDTSEDIRRGLAAKLSPERVAKECSSMISSSRPILAMRMFDRFHLWPTVYGIDRSSLHEVSVYLDPQTSISVQGSTLSKKFWEEQVYQKALSMGRALGWVWYARNQSKESPGAFENYCGLLEMGGQRAPTYDKYRTEDSIVNGYLAHGVLKEVLKEKQLRHLLFVAVIMSPFSQMTYQVKQRRVLFIQYMLQESMKATKRDFTNVDMLLKTSASFQELAAKGQRQPLERAEVSFVLSSAKSLWPHAVDFAIAKDLCSANFWDDVFNAKTNPFFLKAGTQKERAPYTLPSGMVSLLASYAHLHSFIDSEKLNGIWNLPPLMDGKVLMKALEMKPGPQMKQIVLDMRAWQYSNPSGTKEEFLLAFKKDAACAPAAN